MFVAKWYTRASRVRIVIAKFDGRWKIPGGPFPIPELIALVGGILSTLFLLPRLGQPLLTGVIGVCATVTAVAVMRRMPYSPVKFSTRIHRIFRLYTTPASNSAGEDVRPGSTVSVVRPTITILDLVDAIPEHIPTRGYASPSAPQDDSDNGWDDLFARPHSAASELFH